MEEKQCLTGFTKTINSCILSGESPLKNWLKDSRTAENKFQNKHSSLLEYSLLECQVMPESCNSSPDIELQHKRLFSGVVSPLTSNISFLNNFDNQTEESDESFIRMERLIRGSSEDIRNESDHSNSTTDVSAAETVKNAKDSMRLSDKVCTDFDNISTDPVKVDFEPDSLSSDVGNESLNTSARDVESVQNSPSHASQDSSNDTLKFNDTIEEMEYFMKHGAICPPERKHIDASDIKVNELSVKKNIDVKVNELSVKISPKPNIGKERKFFKPNVTENKKPTPVHKLTPFRVPIRAKLTPRNKTIEDKSQTLKTRLNYPGNKYENILSPIRFYIKNSASVPMVKNVSPAKNYWDRIPPGPISMASKIRGNIGKENLRLPEKAYKSPRATKVVEQPTIKRLPHNNKVTIMAENIPKPMLLKHVKREKSSKPSSSVLKFEDCNRVDTIGVEDSFVHLSVKSVDVSHCIGKAAARSKTLK
ncbi:septin interacting protein 2 isoform X2 [Arctopsyche grandis]